MINNITKYFSRIPHGITTHNVFNNKVPLITIKNVKIQHHKIQIINRILVNFFKKFYILISKPIFTITPNGIKISLLYYLPKKNNIHKVRSNQRLISNTKRSSLRTRLQKVYFNKLTTDLGAYTSTSPAEKDPMAPVTTDSTEGAKANHNNINTLNFLANAANAVSLSAKFEQRVFSRSRLTFLVLLLSKILKTNVQLEIVRLKYVYHDSNIFAQFLGINSHKSTYGQFKNLLWKRVTIQNNSNKTELPARNAPYRTSYGEGDGGELQKNNKHLLYQDDLSPVTNLTGFKIKISGRLARQRVVPKKTVKTTYKGAISPNKYNLVDQATFTGKNKKGAYSIRVWTSHGTTPNIP